MRISAVMFNPVQCSNKADLKAKRTLSVNNSVQHPLYISTKDYMNINFRGKEEFIRAASTGDLDAVIRELHNGVDVNAQDINGNTALRASSENGHYKVVARLLKEPNIKVNDYSSYTTTETYNSYDGPEFDYDYDVTHTKNSSLYLASKNGHYRVVELLAKHPNIDINPPDNPLEAAISYGQSKVFDILINIPGIRISDSVQEKAIINYNEAIYKKLFENNPIDVNNAVFTVINNFSSLKDLTVAEKLISDKTFNINTKNNNGNTFLIEASVHHCAKMIERLLTVENIDVNAKNNRGETALHKAYNYAEGLKSLLKHPDIDINARDNEGKTVLIKAAETNNPETIKLLLSLCPDIDVNAKDNNGNTALIAAADCNDSTSVELLLQHPDIDVLAFNKKGMMALGIAENKNCRKTADIINAYISRKPAVETIHENYNKSLNETIRKLKLELILQKSINANANTNAYWTEAIKKLSAEKENLENQHIAEVEALKAKYDVLENVLNIKEDSYKMAMKDIASQVRTLYGIKTDELPDDMTFGEQLIYVVNILNKNLEKLDNTNEKTPENITLALQDKRGDISAEGFKFLSRMLEVSKSKCTEYDLISAIKAVKQDDGALNLEKITRFIANLSWKDNKIGKLAQDFKRLGN